MHDLKLYAKSEPRVTLLDHLLKTLEMAKRIVEVNRNHDPDLVRSALLASALHDIGKADKTFQDQLLGKAKKQSNPHPLMAMPIVDSLLKDVLTDYHRCIVLLAIASHHTPLHAELYDNKIGVNLNVEHLDELKSIIRSISSELGINLKTDSLDIFTKPPLNILIRAKHYITNNVEDRLKLREDFIYVQGVLQQSDWLASSFEEPRRAPSFPSKLVDTNYDYQERASNAEGNILVMLPTGSGKTETALYWAINNYKRHNASRIFYILPTTTAINAMYERLKHHFGKDVVGEYHSNVDLFLDIENDNSLSDDELLMYKYFLMPVNITTPDQLLLSLMNYKKFTLKSFSLHNSLLIVDEIHSYDAETFSMIKFLLNHLHRFYNTRFCIMSATFPTVLKNELGFLNACELIDNDDVKRYYESRRRTRLEYIDSRLKDRIEDITNQIKQGKKVLVVANTVKRAQEIYRILKEEGIEDSLLLHSRYIMKDRHEKEKELNMHKDKHPSLLVATQVVEVSLDIDYDVMFTEVCYIDSLVQRAGRINRRGRMRDPSPVYVFNAEKHFPYESKLLDIAVKIILNEASNNKIRSEWDYVMLTNRFYDEVWNIIRADNEDRFYRVWDNLKYIYSADLSDSKTAELLRTRTGIVSIPAYPIEFYHEIRELHERINSTSDVREKERLYKEKRRYLVNVPLIKYTAKLFTPESIGIFVNLKYNREYGLGDEMDTMI